MNRLAVLLFLIIGIQCVGHTKATGQQLEAGVTVSKLTDKLYTITCAGGGEFNLPLYGTNLVASVGQDGILLVDAGFGETGPALRDTLAALGDGRLKLVISTHDHGDHTFGNQFLKDQATIMGHRSAVSKMSGNYFHLPGPPSPNRPTVGFDDSLIIPFNGEDVRVVHTPNCHSQGDVYVHFTGSGIVAVGDLIFSDEIPYVDLFDNGTVAGYAARIRSFIEDFPDDVTFVAAHGRAYAKDDLREYDRMLTETTRLIREAAAAGKTANDMIQDSLLADWEEWRGQFATTSLEAWIYTVFTEITGGIDARPSICEPLTLTLVEGSVEDAIRQYHNLKSTEPDEHNFGEEQLNMLGYQLIARQRVDDAAEVFKLNAAAYPESSNVYDSYGEALMLKGDTTQSITNYEKSLELNPDNTNATEMLKRLNGE